MCRTKGRHSFVLLTVKDCYTLYSPAREAGPHAAAPGRGGAFRAPRFAPGRVRPRFGHGGLSEQQRGGVLAAPSDHKWRGGRCGDPMTFGIVRDRK